MSFIQSTTTKPLDLYMSLTQNSSPSVGLEAVITLGNSSDHIRIMGCYGAFETIRTASSPDIGIEINGRSGHCSYRIIICSLEFNRVFYCKYYDMFLFYLVL
jgi:hypothetical protein